jgi:hypothetical protein
MILLGGACATVLDAWVTASSWRIAIPPAGIVRRGGAEEPRGTPIGFLRWWFFTPFRGTLFAATRPQPSPVGDELFLLRDGRAVVELSDDSCLRATRRVDARSEHVWECGQGYGPRAGQKVRYQDEASGLSVEVTFESVSLAAPPEEAFRDPDLPGEPASEELQ